jgi:hypothetical protein
LISNNPIAFDATNGMFDPDAQAGNLAVVSFSSGESSLPRGFFMGWIMVTFAKAKP